ncbi:zinc ABC transporter substrate-binding protein [Gilliamella sp. wkB18]|uniref:zinc ABC transporter substrate-binding protein ZnuA n=1 Tax=Gilliamella sp. wkB18 TaxID=3120260 RepID=UPI00054EE2DE|nr:zinc ABC transporter substrate-binding protein ZnuA [Gilliamella apicola]OCG62638.1 zinc ABC transporter substrate-binding protein [Gilliamella apicola]
MKKYIVRNLERFIRFLVMSGSIFVIESMIINAEATIVSSVKPIGFIVEAIASGVTETEILLPDGASPHTYSLTPADLRKIKSAQLVIWIGEDLETFMPAILKNVDKQKQIELIDISDIKVLLRTSHDNNSHEEIQSHHDSSDHDHHGEYDEHIWLSPEIAKIIAKSVHDKLIIQYPDKKDLIDENLSEFTIKLAETEQNIAKKLRNVQNRGYFVFHDAYGYFEAKFGLNNLGSFTINPSVQPGVQKVYAIKQKIKEHQAICIFSEPQFSPAVIGKLVDGTKVRIGELNPLGTDIDLSKDAYSQFLLKLTQQLLDCLDK